jgi:2-keto-4-pentenoate hydratase
MPLGDDVASGEWARETAIERAAEQLVEAAMSSTPCHPVRSIVPNGTLDEAYRVQQLVVARTAASRRLVGHKIGLTSPAVQEQMRVAAPDFGVLFADMAFGDDEPIPTERLIQPRVEAEIAFVLGGDLSDDPVTVADVLRATDFAVAAIEIVDSRIRDWDITIFDTVADNASSGLFVLSGSPRSLRDLPDLRECQMTLTCEGRVLSAGAGSACLGHPVNAVVWLANTLARRGAPLRSGEVVLSGSLGPLVSTDAGKVYEATITGLGSVRARFAT